jgi:epoxyqueuosine reductase
LSLGAGPFDLDVERKEGSALLRPFIVRKESCTSEQAKEKRTVEVFNQTFIREWKNKLDVELMGVASVGEGSPKELREKATALLPSVRSVVVLGKEIYREVVSLLRPGKEAGEAEGGELLAGHTDYLSGRLNRAVHELAGFFRGRGYRTLPLTSVIPTDQRFLTALFSFKHAAHLAGLGTIGHHSMLITPEFGPRVRLACVLTEASVEPSPAAVEEYCVNCEACIRACPARAIEVPGPGKVYSINGFACRAYRQAGLACGVCLKVCDERVNRP